MIFIWWFERLKAMFARCPREKMGYRCHRNMIEYGFFCDECLRSGL